MVTPMAVEKQDQDSDAALSEFVKTQAPDGAGSDLTPPTPAAETPGKVVVGEGGKPGEEVFGAATEEGTPPLGTENRPTEEGEPPLTPAPGGTEAELRRQLEYERHRNDSLQGRLEAQLRPMNDTVRELRGKVVELESALAKKRGAKEEPSVPPHLRHLKPEEAESLGKDALDVQSRIAQGVAESEVENVVGKVEESQKAVEQRLEALEQERQMKRIDAFWGAVEGQVPGARTLNETDSRWAEFLTRADPLSGRTNREIGEAAIAMGDVRRVVTLLEDFKRGRGERPAPAPQVRSEVVRAEAPVPAGPQKKPVIRESQINKFYVDWARGKFRGKEKEAESISAAIEAAVSEGRVIRG